VADRHAWQPHEILTTTEADATLAQPQNNFSKLLAQRFLHNVREMKHQVWLTSETIHACTLYTCRLSQCRWVGLIHFSC